MSLMQLLYTPSQLTLVAGGLVAVLALVTGGYILLNWRKPSASLPKIGSRIQFLWALTWVFWLALAFGPAILLVYLAFIAFLGLKEYFSITPTRRADRRVLFWAYLSIPIQFTLVWMNWLTAFTLFMPIYVFVFLPMLMVVVGDARGFLKAWSVLGWGMLITVFSLGYLAYLLVLPANERTPAGGLGLFLYLVALAQISYVVQFFFGRWFDYPQLRLKVSTTRNWASLAGSVVVTAASAWLTAPLLTPFTPFESLAVGTLIATGSFVGYIMLSAIKGDLQLKDRGSMTPGQGGVLNRIDAIIYTAPIYFYIVSHLHS